MNRRTRHRILSYCAAMVSACCVLSTISSPAAAKWTEGYVCYVSYAPGGKSSPGILLSYALTTKTNCGGDYTGFFVNRNYAVTTCQYANGLHDEEIRSRFHALREAMYAGRKVSVNGSSADGTTTCNNQMNFY